LIRSLCDQASPRAAVAVPLALCPAGEMKHSCTFPVLAQAPEDADALKCKLVALINLKRFDEAIAVFATAPSLSTSCAFEKAYALYRLNCHAEALEVIEAATPKKGVDVRVDLLRAQVLYRLGRYHDCGEVYGALEDDETDPVFLLVRLLLAKAPLLYKAHPVT
jgi:tetratricopeptide (TPR) repeat protein